MADITNVTLYDRDFYAWLNEQAELLRAGRLSELDIKNIAEEIESMSRSEKRELVSRLKILILHLLRWQYQADRRGASWRSSVYNARDALADLLNDSPSLKSQLAGAIETAHARAVRDAADETTLPAATFPKACPWSFTQLSDPDFWPEN
jgi:hypothetical protein